MKMKWDKRYSEDAYAYGEQPNAFFKASIEHIEPGKLLMPADGEGRNGVYAATKGWQVTSFDLSEEGKKKALKLAKSKKVSIEYLVNDFGELQFSKAEFDGIGLIYAHFQANKKSDYHKRLVEYLKPGGTVIFEAFSKNHLEYVRENPSIGGPKDIDSLFSIEEIREDFAKLDCVYLKEEDVQLSEGKYHIGTGRVIRFVGRKLAGAIR